MRIFVFSDSHGDISGMELVLSKSRPDMIIHCGDGAGDAIEIKRLYPDIEVHIVRGNYGDDAYTAIEQEKYLDIMGQSIFVTHGDKFDVYSESATRSNPASKIIEHSKQHGVNIVLHGHTHLATFSFENGVYLLNPGSASLKKGYDYKPSFGCIELDGTKAIFKILSIEVFAKLNPDKLN